MVLLGTRNSGKKAAENTSTAAFPASSIFSKDDKRTRVWWSRGHRMITMSYLPGFDLNRSRSTNGPWSSIWKLKTSTWSTIYSASNPLFCLYGEHRKGLEMSVLVKKNTGVFNDKDGSSLTVVMTKAVVINQNEDKMIATVIQSAFATSRS